MSEIATLNPSDVLDKTAKFFRVMERAGVPWESYQLPINSRAARRNLAEYLLMGCPKVNKDGQVAVTPANDYDLARTILGKDFITPREIAIVRKLTYGDEVLRHFAETLPSEEVLQWLRDNSFVLIAGTPKAMSLLEIRSLNPQLFYTKSGGWYEGDKERFSRGDKVAAEWLMLRKGIMPNSTNKTCDKQQKLLTKVEYIPNVAEATWGETTLKEVRNAWLFPNINARTSSVGSDGSRVYFGNSAYGGVNVDYRWDYDRSDYLGMASARKRTL
jgi:hypothetical protein